MEENPAGSPDTNAARLVVVGAKGRRTVDPLKVPVDRCDFRSPALLAEGDLRRLRGQQNEFARQFSAKVSSSLRLEFTLTLSGISTAPYARFTQGLPDPAHLTLFKMEPLAGLGIICLPPSLGLAITNRMLGGRGPSGTDKPEERALTEIETSLLEDFVRTLAEEWCRHWPEGRGAPPLLVGYETNGKFLQTSPENATMLVVSLEATLGERSQMVQIAMPFAALQSSIKHAGGAPVAKKARAAAPLPDKATLARHAVTAVVPLPVVAEWNVAKITVRDVMNLRAGDVLEMPADTLEKTCITLTGRPLFIGTAGMREGRVAVRLERRLEESSEESKASFLSVLA